MSELPDTSCHTGEVRDPDRPWLVTRPDWKDRDSVDLFLLQNARLAAARMWRCDWIGKLGDDCYLVIGMEDTPEEVNHPEKLLEGVDLSSPMEAVVQILSGPKSEGLSGSRVDLSHVIFPGDEDPHGGPYRYQADGEEEVRQHDVPQPGVAIMDLIRALRAQGFEYVQVPPAVLQNAYPQSRVFVARNVEGLDFTSSLSLV